MRSGHLVDAAGAHDGPSRLLPRRAATRPCLPRLLLAITVLVTSVASLWAAGGRSSGSPHDTASDRTALHARHLRQQDGPIGGSDGSNDPPQQQAVPVILAIAPGSGAVALNATDSTAVDAGLLNTTQCIRLAAGEGGGTAGEQAALGELNPTAGQLYVRPALDLQSCAVSITPVTTNSSTIVVQVRVNALVGRLPPGALQATACNVQSWWPPFLDGAWEVHPAVVQLTAPDVPCLLQIPADALTGLLGHPSAASNTLRVVWDTQGPQPSIRPMGKFLGTSDPRLLLLISFGERVLAANPLHLFGAEGFSRLDVLYDMAAGDVYLAGSVRNASEACIITVEVPAGATTDLAGRPNAAASLQMVYQPESNSSVALGKAFQWMTSASGGTYVAGVLAASMLNPGAAFPTGNNLGAMVGRVQAAFLFGTLSLPQMPDSYRAGSSQLSWIAMDYSIPGAGTPPPDPTAQQQQEALNRLQSGEMAFPELPTAVLVLPSGSVATAELPQQGGQPAALGTGGLGALAGAGAGPSPSPPPPPPSSSEGTPPPSSPEGGLSPSPSPPAQEPPWSPVSPTPQPPQNPSSPSQELSTPPSPPQPQPSPPSPYSPPSPPSPYLPPSPPSPQPPPSPLPPSPQPPSPRPPPPLPPSPLPPSPHPPSPRPPSPSPPHPRPPPSPPLHPLKQSPPPSPKPPPPSPSPKPPPSPAPPHPPPPRPPPRPPPPSPSPSPPPSPRPPPSPKPPRPPPPPPRPKPPPPPPRPSPPPPSPSPPPSPNPPEPSPRPPPPSSKPPSPKPPPPPPPSPHPPPPPPPPSPHPPPPPPPPSSACEGKQNFESCDGQCGTCAVGDCVCMLGLCQCLGVGACITVGQVQCGICGTCSEGDCREYDGHTGHNHLHWLCLSDLDCNPGKPHCYIGNCTLPILGVCVHTVPGRRLLQDAPSPPAPNTSAMAALDASGATVYVVVTQADPAVNATGAAPMTDQTAQEVPQVVEQLNAAFYLGETGELQDLWNTLFWIALALACCLALHATVRGLLIWRRRRVPQFFEWPRPELWLLWCFLPILAAQGAKFLTSSGGGAVVAGVFFGVLIPLAFIAASIHLTLRHVASGASTHQAYYVLVPEAVKARRHQRLMRQASLHHSQTSPVSWRARLWASLPGRGGRGVAPWQGLDVPGSPTTAGGLQRSSLEVDLAPEGREEETVQHEEPGIPTRDDSAHGGCQGDPTLQQLAEHVQRETGAAGSDGARGQGEGEGGGRAAQPQRRVSRAVAIEHQRRQLEKLAAMRRQEQEQQEQEREQCQEREENRQEEAEQPQQAQQAERGAAHPAFGQPKQERWPQRLHRWLLHGFITPVFGYDPAQHGEWVPPQGYDASFVARWGVLFETARGPEVQYRPGTFEVDPVTGRVDRGELVPVAQTRLARMREATHTLGVSIQLLKLVLFAQLAAVLSSVGSGTSSKSAALWQIIPLLLLTVFYSVYVRLFVPLAGLPDLVGEILNCACDLGTCICGLMVACLPVTRYNELNRLGYAMLAFQVAGFICNMLPTSLDMLGRASHWAWRRLRGPTPADKFAAAVYASMAQDQHIAARKFADRWLVKVHRRGLNSRPLHHHEKEPQLLPFKLRRLQHAPAFGRRAGHAAAAAAAEAASAAVAQVEMARRAASRGLLSGVQMGQQLSRSRSGLPILPTTTAPLRPLRASRSRSASPGTTAELRSLLAAGDSAPTSPVGEAAGSPRAAQQLAPISSAAALAAEQGSPRSGGETSDEGAAYATGRRARWLAGMRRRAGN